ncbi:MAG TPA: DUF4835 family protein [Puia sp.]|nr:DUF4835 family protein [Puia sp.]
MHKKIFILSCILLGWLATSRAQELKAGITVLANRISSQIDHRIFQTLQTALNDFLNNRKWTNESFQPNEKIVCNFLLNLSGNLDNQTFQGSLTVQAARPVFNSAYQSPLLNFMDESITFRYVQFQPLDFNETRVQGSEPYAANLTATFAYYVYMILGLNFDSFASRGGDVYFQKALNIVNNAPEGPNIVGWKLFDGPRNRYVLINNLTDARYTQFHDALYNYYRLGLDQMYDKETDARTAILNSLSELNAINTDFPNLMYMQIFFQGRGNELSGVFKKGDPDQKSRALDFLSRLDIPNINKYKQDLQ